MLFPALRGSVDLLFPSLSLVLPVSRKRDGCLDPGAAARLGVLALTGKIRNPPPGDPYAISFGVNILLEPSHIQCMACAIWICSPDKVAHYDQHLAAWVNVARSVGFRASRLRRRGTYRKSCAGIHPGPYRFPARASQLFLYYLRSYRYGSGASLAEISRHSTLRDRSPCCSSFSPGWNARPHRSAEIAEGVLEDPVLRYSPRSRMRSFIQS